jgi:hypothetical protein
VPTKSHVRVPAALIVGNPFNGDAQRRTLWLWVSRTQHISPRHPYGQVCGAGGVWEFCSTCVPTKSHVRVPASTLINKFLYCGSPSSQATFGRGCLGFSIYCPCTPRGRSAELEVRRSWRCAAPSRAHLGCECLGVNIYRLGIPRNRSAELDPGAWDTCNMCTSTKLHVYVRVRMPEKLKCRRSARSRCARRKRIQRRLSS